MQSNTRMYGENVEVSEPEYGKDVLGNRCLRKQNRDNKKMWKYVVLCLIVVFTCCQRDKRLESALEFAADNRGELEKVLVHYKDSGLKYDAACFLIENMPRYYSYEGAALDSAKAALCTAGKDGVVSSELIKRWGMIDLGLLRKVYDARIITADYLIRNIDRAFTVWQKRPWNRYLSFEDFCEQILPYRLENEPLEEWRQTYEERYAFLLDSVYQGSDVIEAAAAVGRYLKEEGFIYNWKFALPHQGALHLLHHRVGTCSDACDLTLYVMRSLGIPAATDCYTYSSETRKGHTWNVIRDTTGCHLGMWFTDRELERGTVYSDGRKAGKVFRKCYAAPGLKDVSAEYYPDTLHVKVAERGLDRLYLGVFRPQPQGWVAIACAPVHAGEAVFPNVEANVVYAPLKEEKGKGYRTVDYPFFFDGKEVHPYVPDLTKPEKVRLLRKHTLFTWIWDYLQELHGACFEFSDERNFRQVKYSYCVPDTPRVCYNEVVLQEPVSFRYARFRAPEDEGTDLAELQVFGNGEQHFPVRMEGEEPETSLSPVGKAFDNEPMSKYSTRVPGAVLWMDFGQTVEMERLVFIARNDDNYIRVGDAYELFYHGGSQGWISLGQKVATESRLVYDNMPHGALFHLRCLTRGVEEQVFHVENGRQVFVSNQGVELQ